MKIKTLCRALPYILQTIYFNFKYLPIHQAKRLPILLHKPHLRILKGEIKINSEIIYPGMIRLGFPQAGLHDDKGIVIELGGKIVFNGPMSFATNGYISVGQDAVLEIGKHTAMNENCRIMCFHKTIIGDYTCIGWDCTLCDTSFHRLKNAFTGAKTKKSAPIILGSNNWIAQSCLIMKGTKTKNYITVNAGSLLNQAYRCSEKSILMGNPATVFAEGCYYLDREDCD